MVLSIWSNLSWATNSSSFGENNLQIYFICSAFIILLNLKRQLIVTKIFHVTSDSNKEPSVFIPNAARTSFYCSFPMFLKTLLLFYSTRSGTLKSLRSSLSSLKFDLLIFSFINWDDLALSLIGNASFIPPSLSGTELCDA